MREGNENENNVYTHTHKSAAKAVDELLTRITDKGGN